MSETQAGPSKTPTASKRRPEPIPAERNTSLGRILYSTWHDKASPLYDCFDAALREQEAAVAPWLADQIAQNHRNAVLKAAEAKFAATLATLRSAGSSYDPRTRNDDQILLPGSPVRAKAVAARRAWEDVVQLREEAKTFEGVLVCAADAMRGETRQRLEVVRRAQDLHVRFLTGAWRRALRWRVLGRIVAYGIRWMRRALGGRSG